MGKTLSAQWQWDFFVQIVGAAEAVLQRNGIISLKQTAAGGEACKQIPFFCVEKIRRIHGQSG